MADFKKERVFFTVIGQGSIDIEYEVGAETPIEAFRRSYDSNHGRPHKVRHFDLRNLILEADDFEWVITCATEPTDERVGDEPIYYPPELVGGRTDVMVDMTSMAVDEEDTR